MAESLMGFERAVKIVLAREGLRNTDLGGDTVFGIARKWHPNVTPWPPTLEQAIAIYKREYWDRWRCGELPFPLDVALFDAVVNQKTPDVVQEFQLALKVEPDGIVGDDTVFAATQRDVWETLALFFARRVLRYATKSQEHEKVGLCARLFRNYRDILVSVE